MVKKRWLLLMTFLVVHCDVVYGEEIKDGDVPREQHLSQAHKADQETLDVVHSLRDRIQRGDASALHQLFTLANQGNALAAAILQSIHLDPVNPGDITSRKALRETDASEFVEAAKKGNVNAIHGLLLLGSYGNVYAQTTLKELDLTALIARAKQGDMEAFSLVSMLAFQNPAAAKALGELDFAKLSAQVDMAKDENATGKMAVLALLNPVGAQGGAFAKKFQDANADQLLNEANKGNHSALDVLLTKCRAGDVQALAAVKHYDPAELIERAQAGDRNAFFQLNDLRSFGNLAAQEAFTTHDFPSILIRRINHADTNAVEMLKVLTNRKLASPDAYTSVDTAHLVELATQGNADAVTTLVRMDLYFHGRAVQKGLMEINPAQFVQQANQGDHGGITALISLYHALYRTDNSPIQQALAGITPDKYIEAAKEGDSYAYYSLRHLAAYGNLPALNALTRLAQGGDASAQRALEQANADTSKVLRRQP